MRAACMQRVLPLHGICPLLSTSSSPIPLYIMSSLQDGCFRHQGYGRAEVCGSFRLLLSLFLSFAARVAFTFFF